MELDKTEKTKFKTFNIKHLTRRFRWTTLLLMFFSIPLVGCLNTGSCNRVRLSEAEKKWIEFYSEGDTLIFGNTKQIKEFVVTDKGSGFTA